MFQVLLCPCGYKTCGWQVKLCDPIKHGALLERFEDLWIIKCAIQVLILHSHRRVGTEDTYSTTVVTGWVNLSFQIYDTISVYSLRLCNLGQYPGRLCRAFFMNPNDYVTSSSHDKTPNRLCTHLTHCDRSTTEFYFIISAGRFQILKSELQYHL